MQPLNDRTEQQFKGSVYESLFEAPQPNLTPVHGSVPLQGLPNTFLKSRGPHVSVFRLNSKALLITVAVLSVATLTGIGIAALKAPKPSGQPSSQYAVSTLPLNGVQGTNELTVGKVDQLTVNGLLQANNTIILNPSSAPTSAKAGQIYYDEVTNEPFFYNGLKFVSLNPTAPVAATSIGGSTGVIGIGQGLTIAGNQLGISNIVLNNLVTNLTGTANQILTSASKGAIKLSLPQDINTTSTPTFGGIIVNGNSLNNGNQTTNGQIQVNGSSVIDNTAKPTGPELIVNGTFTGNANGWTLGSDVVYGTNNVISTYAGGDPQLYRSFETVAGNTYMIRFTVSNANAPARVWLDNNPAPSSTGPFPNGTYTTFFKANWTGPDTIFFTDYNLNIGDTWTLDDVSMQQVIIAPALKVAGYNGNTFLSLSGDILGNTALGDSALQLNDNGFHNTAIGLQSMQNSTGGGNNTAVGAQSLQANISGQYNSAIGISALQNNTNGSDNTANGVYALVSNIDGNINTATGSQALQANTSGSENTAVGSAALISNTTAWQNTALGYTSLQNNTTGERNTAVGAFSLQSNSTGTNNTAIGFYSGAIISTGSSNIILGASAGGNLTTGSNNVAIGANTVFSSQTADNQLQIGAGISGDLASGTLQIKTVTNSATAFQVQNTAATPLFTADTSGMVITVAGTDANYATLTLTDAHFKSSQTTAPTIGTPANCGVSPTAVVTAGSTDTAGSFSITVGTGGASTTCDTVVTFNKPYAVVPKSIIVTFTQAVGGANIPLWFASISASSTNSFTIKEASVDLSGFSHNAGDISSYYYWVIE